MKSVLQVTVMLLNIMIPLQSAVASGDEKAGTTAATFLKLGIGARAAAMGYSGIALANDASSVYWNPALLSHIDRMDVILSHNLWIAEMQHSFIGVAMPHELGTLGAGVTMLRTGKQTRTEAAPGGGFVKTGDFTNLDIAAHVGVGVKLFEQMGIGVGAKVIYENLAEKSTVAFAGDVGLYGRIEMVDIGVVGRNFGSQMKFNDVAYKLPTQILGGVAVHLLDNTLAVSASGGNIGESKTQFSFGAEFLPIEYVAVRGGYRTGFQDISGGLKGLTAGAGLNYGDIKIDYAFNAYGDLGATHHITLGFKLGGTNPKPEPSSALTTTVAKPAAR